MDPVPYYYWVVALVVVMLVVIRRLERSRIGRAWVAIREDEVAAEAMGINTLRMKLWAFAIGASTAGFAGVDPREQDQLRLARSPSRSSSRSSS